MKWTTEMPTQSGIYWVKADPGAEALIVQVNASLAPDRLGSIDYMGTDDCGYLKSFAGALWCGPITPPSEE